MSCRLLTCLAVGAMALVACHCPPEAALARIAGLAPSTRASYLKRRTQVNPSTREHHYPMTFHASRTIAASPSSVLAAFADRARLARWWGPAGFTSTFETFAFEPGGHWSFTMHGPDGKNYPNAIVVTEIARPGRLVLHHVSPPRYRLTVTLEPTADEGTLVGWHQEFESSDVGRRMESIVVTANEQLLDRLSAEVSREQMGAHVAPADGASTVSPPQGRG